MEQLIYMVVGFAAFLLAALLYIKWRASTLSRRELKRADELQAYLTACVDDLRRVLAQRGKDPATISREAYDVLARMEARNTDGNLDAFIQDNRESVELVLKHP